MNSSSIVYYNEKCRGRGRGRDATVPLSRSRELEGEEFKPRKSAALIYPRAPSTCHRRVTQPCPAPSSSRTLATTWRAPLHSQDTAPHAARAAVDRCYVRRNRNRNRDRENPGARIEWQRPQRARLVSTRCTVTSPCRMHLVSHISLPRPLAPRSSSCQHPPQSAPHLRRPCWHAPSGGTTERLSGYAPPPLAGGGGIAPRTGYDKMI